MQDKSETVLYNKSNGAKNSANINFIVSCWDLSESTISVWVYRTKWKVYELFFQSMDKITNNVFLGNCFNYNSFVPYIFQNRMIGYSQSNYPNIAWMHNNYS